MPGHKPHEAKDWRKLYEGLLKGVRVLVVDDEPAICDVVCELLEDFHVDAVGSAESAWDLIETNPYDLLVVDKNLPGISGVRLLGKVRDAGLEIPSILITGYASLETISEALTYGASDYIEKPFDLGHLEKRIHAVLDRRLSGLLYQIIVDDLNAAIKAGIGERANQLVSEALLSFQKENRRLSVLIVDEQSPVLDGIARTLNAGGFSTDVGLTPDALFNRVKRPDGPLVGLLALQLPGIVDLIERLRAIDPRVQVLVFALGTAPLELALRTLSAGASDFVLFADEGLVTLKARVEHAVSRARRHRFNLHLVGTLYRVASDLGYKEWDELLELLPDEDSHYVREISKRELTLTVPTARKVQDEAEEAERRSAERTDWNQEVWVDSMDDTKRSWRAQASNISLSGMFIAGRKAEVGSSVTVFVPHGIHDTGSVVGRVVRWSQGQEPEGFAIEFVHVDAVFAEMIESLGGRY